MFDKQTIKEYIFTAFGSFIVAFGIYYFMVPENLVIGGVTGLAIVINNYLPLSISAINLILNIILLGIGFTFIGRGFGGKTIFSIFLISFFISLMENTYPFTEPLTDEILLNLFCGIIITAMGLSIVFNQNASTGGTDILAKIFNKYFNFDMGKGLMAADTIVVVSAFFTYGMKTGIVGAFGWFLNGVIVNYFIDGFSVKREVVIATKNPIEVKNYILSKLNRGVTIYKAQGGYTSEPKDIIVTILNKSQYFILKKELKNLDSEVFVFVRNIQEVLGQGFNKF